MDSISRLTALLLMPLVGGVSAQPITCEAGRFKEGQPAFVTCDFHRSLQDIPHHIYVVQRPFNKPNYDDGKEILGCFRSIGQKLVCKAIAAGVRFTGITGGRVTITIPGVSTDFAGDYLCQLVPPDGTTITTCSLTVEETSVSSFNGTHSQAQSETSNLQMIVGVTVSVCIAVIAILTCAIIFWRRRIKRRRLQKGSNHDRAVRLNGHGPDSVADRSSHQGHDRLHRSRQCELPAEMLTDFSTSTDIVPIQSLMELQFAVIPVPITDGAVGSGNGPAITETNETATTSMVCTADDGLCIIKNGSSCQDRKPSISGHSDSTTTSSECSSGIYYST